MLSGQDAVRGALARRSRQRLTRHLVTNIDLSDAGAGLFGVRVDVLVLEKEAAAAFAEAIAKPVGRTLLLTSADLLERTGDGIKIKRKQARTFFSFAPG